MRGIGARHFAAIVAAALLLAAGATTPAVAAPSATLDVAFAPDSPAPPVLNLPYSYAFAVGNDGDVPLDAMVLVAVAPVELGLSRVTTGAYTGLSEFAAGEGVRVSYEKNTAPGVFTLWGSSPNVTTNTALTNPPPGLGAGEYVTRVRWEYGQAAPGMQASTRPVLAGRVTNPDNTGGPVAVGDPIQTCATLTAVYTAGPTNVTRNDCHTFGLIAGPAIALTAPDSAPLGSDTQATATLSGGAPTGSLTFRVFAASDTACATALLDESVQVSGARAYAGPAVTSTAAGAYKWVVRYNGDTLHAAGATGCNDPAGAFAVVAPPAVSASFATAEIVVGASTALRFTIANPSANTVPLTGVALEDTLPPGLAVASPSGLSGSCGGAIIAAPGSQSVTLAGGTVAVGSSCSFAVNVTGLAPGAFPTTTEAVESANGGTGNTATASLMVRAPVDPPVPPAVPSAPVDAPSPVTPSPLAPPSPVAPGTAQELALTCSPADLVMLAADQAARRVRFRGAASPADAGQRVIIRALPARTVAARATVLADGSFAATGPRVRRRAVHTTRYYAELGARRSTPLKLTRRLTARLTATAASVTISGRVAPPLGNPIRRVVITRLTSCAAGDEVVARVRPGPRGRFRVTLPRAPGAGPALYRALTQVRTKGGAPLGTRSLVLAEA